MTTPEGSRSAGEDIHLFHYTTAEGLRGILTSQVLRATHSDFLNDPSECQIIKDVLTPHVTQDLKLITAQLIERKLLRDEFEREFGEEGYPKEADQPI